MTPSFIIGGATQSGMSIIRDLLSQNTGIFLPNKATPSFFSKDQRFHKGPDFYARYFAKAGRHQVCGDLSPSYFEHGIVLDDQGKYRWSPKEDSALRIKKQCPQVKMIFALRNPLERAFEQYTQARRAKREKVKTFEDAVREEIKGDRQKETNALCYLYRNTYHIHIEHWIKLFGRRNIHVCLYDDLVRDPENTINEMERFIGVRPRNFGNSSQSGRAPQSNSGDVLASIKAAIMNMDVVKKYLEKRQAGDNIQEPSIATIEKPESDAAESKPKKATVKIDPEFEKEWRSYLHTDLEKLKPLLGREDLTDLWGE